MIAPSPLARVSFCGLLFLLTACGSKKGGNEISPPGPRPAPSCEAFKGAEPRQKLETIAKLFNSRANSRAMAVAAFALTEKMPFECLEFVEQ